VEEESQLTNIGRQRLRSDIGVWVVGAVALIALVVFGGLWLMQSSLLSRLDSIATDGRRQGEKLEQRVGQLQEQVKRLRARLEPSRVAPAAAETASAEPAPAASPEPEPAEPASSKGAVRGEKVYVRLTSRPSKARVRRDGRTLGRTPLILPLGRGESVSLLVSRRGYVGQKVSVTGGAEAVKEIRLRRPSRGAAKPDKDQPTLFDPYAD
jgi:hypothetical protein